MLDQMSKLAEAATGAAAAAAEKALTPPGGKCQSNSFEDPRES